MKFTLLLTFTGLYALVPDWDAGTVSVLLIDTEQAPVCANAEPVEHSPMVSLPPRNLKRDPENHPGSLFTDSHGQRSLCAPLDKVEIALQYTQSATAVRGARPKPPWRTGRDSNGLGHKNVPFLVRMQDIWKGRQLPWNKTCLEGPALCDRLVARMNIADGWVFAGSFGAPEPPYPVWEFVDPSSPRKWFGGRKVPTGGHRQPLADRVMVEIPDLEGEVVLSLNKHEGSTTVPHRSWTLVPTRDNDVIEVAISNAPRDPGDEEELLHHFAWFYQLLDVNEFSNCRVPDLLWEPVNADIGGDVFCPGTQLP